MKVNALKAVLDFQAANGNGEIDIKILAPNGVVVDPVEVDLETPEQQLIPENPAGPQHLLMKCPQA